MPKRRTTRSSNGGKFRATRVRYFGHEFDSLAEGHRYLELRQWQIEGQIEDLELQPQFTIVIGGVPVRYPSGRQVKYKADFRYWCNERGQRITEEVKSKATAKMDSRYRLLRAVLYTAGIQIEEVIL